MIGKSFKNLRNAIIVLFLIILTGTSGFMLIEDWNFPDSLYMTIINNHNRI
jgi:HD-like signal output (HDOD) protein